MERILHQQATRIAIPKRFAMAMEEIWLLQPRFELRQRKRVMRLLAHPRFRAAYDFLVLRSHEEPELCEQVQWWTEAQGMSAHDLSESLAVPSPARSEDAPAGKRKRPRRRKRKAGSAAGGAETATQIPGE